MRKNKLNHERIIFQNNALFTDLRIVCLACFISALECKDHDTYISIVPRPQFSPILSKKDQNKLDQISIKTVLEYTSYILAYLHKCNNNSFKDLIYAADITEKDTLILIEFAARLVLSGKYCIIDADTKKSIFIPNLEDTPRYPSCAGTLVDNNLILLHCRSAAIFISLNCHHY